MFFCGQLPRMLRSSAIVWRDEEALGISRDVGELPARFADSRRVDQRQDLLDVLDDRPKEQAFVPFLKRRQQHVSIDVSRQTLEIEHHPVDQLARRRDAMRQQAGQTQAIPFPPSEADRSIERLVAEDGRRRASASWCTHRSAGHPRSGIGVFPVATSYQHSPRQA
jgi:hypothetical protein